MDGHETFRTWSCSAKSALIAVPATIVACGIRICPFGWILPFLIRSAFSILLRMVIIRRRRIFQYVVVFLIPFYRFVPLKNFVLGAERYTLRPMCRIVAISEAFLLVFASSWSSLLAEKFLKITHCLGLIALSFYSKFNFRNHSLGFRIILGYFFKFRQGFLGRLKTFPADFKINIPPFALYRIKTRFSFHNFVNFFIALKLLLVFLRNKFFANFRIASALVKIYIFTRHGFKKLKAFFHFFFAGKAVFDGKISARPRQFHIFCLKSFFAGIFYSHFTSYLIAIGSYKLHIFQVFQVKISRLLSLRSSRRQFFHAFRTKKFLRDFIARLQ